MKAKKTLIQNLDSVARKYTAFDDFKDLAFSCLKSSYRPTLYVLCAKEAAERRALKFLADHYDRAMECMGQSRRAYRC